MSQVAALRSSFKTMHDFLENTVADLGGAQADWRPPGLAHSIGANYAHVVLCEDGVVNGMLKGGAPLMGTRCAGKPAASEPQPQGFAWSEWGGKVTVDVAAMREYANAVYAAPDEFLAGL